MIRYLTALAALAVLTACVKNVESKPAVERRAVRLLALTAERETLKIPEVASQLEADTDQERTPHIVAVGESPLLPAEGVDVWLAGDEQGTTGFSVDNCILIEVLSDDGKRVGRAAIGYLNGLSEGKEQIDLLGRRAFKFEANEVNLVTLLPEKGRFRVRATVLDIGGVGYVSDLFLIITPRSAAASDDLRER
ncbi:MAG: hypothetical protein Q8L48_24300 [Archangium sp.]|nr:hypothetical protein [Archangium sp.]